MKADELTDLGIEWLLRRFPEATIVREMSVSDWGGALVDIAAITATEIVGIEIKGEGDSPARLPLQRAVYGRVVRRMWLLPDVSLKASCIKKAPKGWGLLEVCGGKISVHKTRIARTQKLLCPYSMCGTLWRDELYEVARLNNVTFKGRGYVRDITEAIVHQLPAPTIHDAMIRELRHRKWRKPVINGLDKNFELPLLEKQPGE